MMEKIQILPFLFLFFIITSLGCIGPLQDGGDGEPKKNKTVEGVLKSKILINGENKKSVTLISEQRAEVGVQVQNIGNQTLYNLSAKLIGIDWEGENETEIDEMKPGQENYLFWTVKAPEMSSGQEITMPARIRAYFDRTSEGYTDLKIYPAKMGSVSPPIEHSRGKLIDMEFNVGVVRMLNQSKNITGELKLKNTGPGWVDYPTYNKSKGHCKGMNLIRKVSLNISSNKSDRITFIEPEAGDLKNENKTLVLECNEVENSNLYRLRMLDQSRLKIPFELNIPKSYSGNRYTGRIYVEVNYGYATKLTGADITMEG